MAQKSRKYIVRTPDGGELPPADAETLQEWIREQRITRDCEIRPQLVFRWTPLTEYDFLRRTLDEVQPQKQKRRFSRAQNQSANVSASTQDYRFIPYTPAGAGLRFLSGLFDGIIIAVCASIINICTIAVFADGSALGQTAPVALFFAFVLLYYTWCIGFRAQTPGQQFWGVMVVTRDAGPVLAARAVLFSVLTLFLGVPFIIPALLGISRHTPAEKLTNTRVVFIRISSSFST